VPKVSENDHWPGKYNEDSAANLLFQQITSGQVLSNSRKKNKRRFSPEHVMFESDEYEDETSLMICDSSESLAAAVEKVKAAKNPIKTSPVWEDDRNRSKLKKNDISLSDKEKRKKKLPAMTAYTLFTRENRHRIQQGNPAMDFASISRRLGEVWQALPAREKMQWKRRAQNYRNQAISQMSNSIPNLIRRPPAVSVVRAKPINTEPIVVKYSGTPKLLSKDELEAAMAHPARDIGTSALDTAACFRIMGESLHSMGNKISENAADLTSEVSLDILLDATLCSFASLLSLTTHHKTLDACEPDVHHQLIDSMSHIMPGVQ
jgi:high mobility group protein 2-like 1